MPKNTVIELPLTENAPCADQPCECRFTRLGMTFDTVRSQLGRVVRPGAHLHRRLRSYVSFELSRPRAVGMTRNAHQIQGFINMPFAGNCTFALIEPLQQTEIPRSTIISSRFRRLRL